MDVTSFLTWYQPIEVKDDMEKELWLKMKIAKEEEMSRQSQRRQGEPREVQQRITSLQSRNPQFRQKKPEMSEEAKDDLTNDVLDRTWMITLDPGQTQRICDTCTREWRDRRGEHRPTRKEKKTMLKERRMETEMLEMMSMREALGKISQDQEMLQQNQQRRQE